MRSFYNEEYKVKAKISPSDVDDDSITWSSSNEDVAKVDNDGLVEAVSPGKATITVKTCNGKKEEEEKYEYRLSDLYKNSTIDPDLELRVTVFNINMGMNEKLMEECKTLREYSIFVAQLRRNVKIFSAILDETMIIKLEYRIKRIFCESF